MIDATLPGHLLCSKGHPSTPVWEDTAYQIPALFLNKKQTPLHVGLAPASRVTPGKGVREDGLLTPSSPFETGVSECLLFTREEQGQRTLSCPGKLPSLSERWRTPRSSLGWSGADLEPLSCYQLQVQSPGQLARLQPPFHLPSLPQRYSSPTQPPALSSFSLPSPWLTLYLLIPNKFV